MRVISLSVIFISIITVLVFVNAFPTDNKHVRQNTLSDVYEIYPDETPDSVLSVKTGTTRRVKRSDIIGFIRQICPPLANFINDVFQRVKKMVFKLVGRLLLGGNRRKPTGGEEKPAVIVNLPTYPPEEETTEPVTDTDSSSSSESTSSSDSSSTETSPSSNSSSSKSSSPSSDNSIAHTSPSKSKTTSTTENHSTSLTNSISTNEFQVDELTEDDYHYDC